MTKYIFVVENEFGEAESKSCDTLNEAKAELKHVEDYYKREMGWNDYHLEIVKYEEEV